MGLDITVLQKVKYIGNDSSRDEEMYARGYEYAWVNGDFPARADGRKTGYYDAEKRISFRAGSYSGYGMFREHLARMAHGVNAEHIWRNPDEYSDKPFYELINFADNEGIIGPGPAARLAQAFAEYDAHARHQDEYFYEQYRLWRLAFQMAADDGLIIFH